MIRVGDSTCLPDALVVKPGGLRKLLVFPERLARGVFISITHLGGGPEVVKDIFDRRDPQTQRARRVKSSDDEQSS